MGFCFANLRNRKVFPRWEKPMGDEPTTENEEPTEEEIKEFEKLRKQIEHDFYYFIGRSITSWSITEGHLVYVAAMLLDTTQKKAGLVLYSIINFYTWLSIIDELFAMDPKYQPLRPDWIAIDKQLKKLNDVRVRLAHHTVRSGKGVEALLSDGNEMEAFASLKPSRHDHRSKSLKLPSLRIEELGDFINGLSEVTDAILKLMDRMEPIFNADRNRLADRIKQLRQRITNLVWIKKEFPQIAGG
jgi:hypothetical protein